jgi:hypothetical protein
MNSFFYCKNKEDEIELAKDIIIKNWQKYCNFLLLSNEYIGHNGLIKCIKFYIQQKIFY